MGTFVFVTILFVIFLVHFSNWKSKTDLQIDQLSKEIDRLKSVLVGVTKGTSPEKFESHSISIAEDEIVKPIQEDILDTQFIPDPIVSETDPVDRSWLTKNRPMKLGGLIFFLGLVWGVSYAFINNRISPAARIGLGVLVGALFMVGGYLRLDTNKDHGSILLGVGSAAILVVMYLGRLYYGYFSPTIVLGVSALIVAVQGYISVQKDLPIYATYALLLGLVAPLLTHSVDQPFVGLFGYLAILYIGSMVVMRQTGRSRLPLIGLASYVFYSFPYLVGLTDIGPNQIPILITTAIFGIFGFSNIMDLLHRDDEVSQLSLTTAFVNAIFHIGRVHVLIPDQYRGVVLLLLAVIFVYIAYLFYQDNKNLYPLYVYGTIGVIYLLVATTYEFDGPALTLAYIFEILAVSMSALFLLRKPKLSIGLLFGLIGPFGLAASQGMLDSINRSGGVLHRHALILGIFVVSFFVLSYVYTRYQNSSLQKSNDTMSADTNILFLIFGIFSGLTFIYLAFAGVSVDQIRNYRGLASIVFGLGVFAYSEFLLGQFFYQKSHPAGRMLFTYIVLISASDIAGSRAE